MRANKPEFKCLLGEINVLGCCSDYFRDEAGVRRESRAKEEISQRR